jgi:23S rRNA (cytidine1920-2'-O)/16S rRNA (cytidine1409-2'-O)-methyltransferase
MARKRADHLAWERGLASSAEQAARLIMAGEIWLAPSRAGALPERVDKAGDLLPEGVCLERRELKEYVGRGALKLLAALESFGVEAQGLTALDAGASTGGFTDCLLRRGVKRVYAVDVGRGQLHERLRADPRVINLEGVNLRLAGPDILPERVDLVSADLSFISLKSVLPALLRYLKPGGAILALIKPQFELGSARTVKGVVRRESLRREAVNGVLEAAEALGLALRGVAPAAVPGAKGNQEYMAYWVLPGGVFLAEAGPEAPLGRVSLSAR